MPERGFYLTELIGQYVQREGLSIKLA